MSNNISTNKMYPGKICAMSFTVQMDREINEKHRFSPGGYELRFKNGKSLAFDFYESEIGVDPVDPQKKTANFFVKCIDVDSFDTTVEELCESLLTSEVEEIVDCYIDTEGGEDICPVSIIEWTIQLLRDWSSWDSEVIVSLPSKVLSAYNFA